MHWILLVLSPILDIYLIADSVIEGVEFHTIDAMKQEENIYEPAPGEVSVGRNQNKDGDTRSCSSNLENHM